MRIDFRVGRNLFSPFLKASSVFVFAVAVVLDLALVPALGQTQPPSNDPRMNLPADANQARDTYNAGVTLNRAKDYSGAASKFQEVVRAQPNFFPGRLAYAQTLRLSGRELESVWEYEAAARIIPDNGDVLLGLGAAYQVTGQRDKAITQYERYLWLYPGGPDAATIKASIQSMKDENQRSSVFANSRGKDNYLEECLTERVYRWRIAQMPVPIYIYDDPTVQGYKPEFRQMVVDSFDEWSKAANGRISFKFVDAPEKALIEVKFTANKADMSKNANEQGETATIGTTGRLKSAKIILLTVSDKGTPSLNIKGVCLHEVGHALGLSGHSSDPADIMFMFSKPNDLRSVLSFRDQKTILRLYSLSSEDMDNFASHSNQASLFDKQNLTKGEQAAQRCNDDGAIKFGAGNFLEASKLFEQALSINPNSSVFQLNAGKAYFKLGLQEIKADESIKAQRHLELAAKYFKLARNPELIAGAYQNLAFLARQAKNETDAKLYEAEAVKAFKAQPKAPRPKK